MAPVGPIHQWNSPRRGAAKPPLPWAELKLPPEAPSPELCAAVLQGLRSQPAQLPSSYLFDLRGSSLFEVATESPDYFLARAELGVVHAHASDMARRMGPCPELIEFDAGAMRMARRLIEEADQPVRYLATDDCAPHLQARAAGLQQDYPLLDVRFQPEALAQHTPWPAPHPGASRRIVIMGGHAWSRIEPGQRLGLLQNLARRLRGGALLVTVDQVRDTQLIERAYDDARGCMAEFNLNALHRCRRDFGLQWAPSDFTHEVQILDHGRGVRLRLRNPRACTLALQDQGQIIEQHLPAGAGIETLRLHPGPAEELQTVARRAGFAPGPCWQDTQGRVAICWLEAPPP